LILKLSYQYGLQSRLEATATAQLVSTNAGPPESDYARSALFFEKAKYSVRNKPTSFDIFKE
jgi:hypothetical protein